MKKRRLTFEDNRTSNLTWKPTLSLAPFRFPLSSTSFSLSCFDRDPPFLSQLPPSCFLTRLVLIAPSLCQSPPSCFNLHLLVSISTFLFSPHTSCICLSFFNVPSYFNLSRPAPIFTGLLVSILTFLFQSHPLFLLSHWHLCWFPFNGFDSF